MPRTTRTSTDDIDDAADTDSPSPSPSPRPSPKRFRRGLLATLAALAIACGTLGAASILQGPKLEGSQLDAAAAAGAPGQQLRLVVNQAVAPVTSADVSVTPAVPFTVQSQGSVIAITFRAALDYATAYRVSVSHVSSPRGGASATLHAAIATPAFGFDYLARGTGTDRILHATVGSPTRTVVYEAPGIQDFAPLDGAMVVVRDDGSGGSRIDIVQLHGGNVETLTLPDEGRVNAITVVGTDILYTFTSAKADPIPQYDQTLFKVDLQAQHTSVPVDDLSGKPLVIDAWQPVPGTGSLLLHAVDESLLRYDPASPTPPVPFAYDPIMGGLSPDQKRVGTVDAFGPNSLDISSGVSTPLNVAPVAGQVPYADVPTPLDAGRTIVRLAIPHAGTFTAEIALNSTVAGVPTSKKLYAPGGPTPQIHNYRLTSNGRYLVVEFEPDYLHSTPDGSSVNRQPTSITTDIVDVTTGATVLEVAGFDGRW